MAKGTLTVRIIGDARSFGRTLDRAGRRIGRFAAAAATAGAAVAGAFAVSAVRGAMELNETLSKTEQVFKSASSDVVSFADDMADAFGLPKQELLDAASNIGLVAKASGLAESDAADLSTEMAKLAADASSFFNVPLDQALEKIRAGLVGEAEPLRAFGVLLSAAAVKSKAVELGIAGANEELTEQQKVTARAAIITDQMSDASGDLERTQDSLANRVRRLQGDWQNLRDELGTYLIPIVQRVLDKFNELRAWIEAKWPDIKAAVQGLAESFQTWWDETIVPIIGRVAEAMTTFWEDHAKPAIDGFVGAWEDNGPSIELIIDRLASIIEDLGEIIENVWTDATDQIDTSGANVEDRVGSMIRTFATLIDRIAMVVSWMEQLSRYTDVVRDAFELMNPLTPLQGLIPGGQDGSTLIPDPIQNGVNNLLEQAAPFGGGFPGQTAGGGGDINLTINTTGDGQDLADRTVTELRELQIINGYWSQ